jgi:hypothetical protein
MPNRRILILNTIAFIFSLPLTVVQATNLKNVNLTTHNNTVAAGNPAEHILSDGIPTSTFDNISDGNVIASVPDTGIVYATELFGNDSALTLPKNKRAAVLYTIDGQIDQIFKIIFTLSAGVFAQAPKLAISDKNNDGYTSLNDVSIIGGGQGNQQVSFIIDADNDVLENGDQLMLVYQLSGVKEVLATADGQIDLTVELQSLDGLPVNLKRTVTVARSKQAIQIELQSENSGSVNISTANQRQSFSGSGGAYIDKNTAQIGFIKITHFSTLSHQIMAADGETPLKIGDGTDGEIVAGSDQGGSKLALTSGQFAASLSPPGRVFLFIDEGNEIVAQVTDKNTASFPLDKVALQKLSTGNEIPIRITVDGTTAINTVENPPEATLTIDFKQDYVTDIGPLSQTFRQIHKDGVSCMIYIVPDTSIPREKINIRITNKSNVDGSVSGRMYDQDGNSIGVPAPLKNGLIAAGETMYLNAEDLEKKFSWTGRAMLEITATLPSLEVMALMRNQADRSLLTNLSVGASGNSCSATQ